MFESSKSTIICSKKFATQLCYEQDLEFRDFVKGFASLRDIMVNMKKVLQLSLMQKVIVFQI